MKNCDWLCRILKSGFHGGTIVRTRGIMHEFEYVRSVKHVGSFIVQYNHSESHRKVSKVCLINYGGIRVGS